MTDNLEKQITSDPTVTKDTVLVRNDGEIVEIEVPDNEAD